MNTTQMSEQERSRYIMERIDEYITKKLRDDLPYYWPHELWSVLDWIVIDEDGKLVFSENPTDVAQNLGYLEEN